MQRFLRLLLVVGASFVFVVTGQDASNGTSPALDNNNTSTRIKNESTSVPPDLSSSSSSSPQPENSSPETTPSPTTLPVNSSAAVELQPRLIRYEEDSSWLCSGTGDTTGSSVGRHLGCSCVNLETGGLLEADCSGRWIGSGLEIPPYLNISVHVRLLDMSGNELTGITESTFGECDSVFSLYLMNNHIEDISGLGKCRFLQKVDLSWNKLERIGEQTFTNLSRLRELDLSNNNITDVAGGAFGGLISLKRLVLASNPLGNELMSGDEYTLDLGGMVELEELDLSNCSFPDFPLYLFEGNGTTSAVTSLKKLVLKNNMISYLSDGLLHKLGHLEALDLSGNWFQRIEPYAFVGLTSLRSLRLDKMPYLESIEAHAFAGLVELKELHCQKNHFLHHIDPMAFRVTIYY